MNHSRKNTRFHRWVAGLLLAAYGSAGVLGHGLHTVWECEHHCHVHSHAERVAHSHVHGHDCHHHHHDCGLEVANRGDDHATLNLATEDCPICEFLVQAQSPFALELTTDCVVPIASNPEPFYDAYNSPLVGVRSARGPPLG